MKRNIVIALLMCTAPCLLKAQGQFVLKGKIGNLKDVAKIYLQWGEQGEKKDSAILQNGEFSFAGNLTGPVKAKLYCGASPKSSPDLAALFMKKSSSDLLELFLENGTISVNSPDSLKNATITGSTINDDNKRLQALLEPNTAKSTKLCSELLVVAMTKGNDTAFKSEIRKKVIAIEEERKMVLQKFISENPGSYISLINIKDVVEGVSDYSDAAPLFNKLFNKLSEKLRNSAEGKKVAERMEQLKSLSIGAMAPDFTQNDTSGVPVKLSSFRGRYVLLDFWASWCSPCRAESPYLVKAYDKFKSKGFQILSVSCDDKKEKWLAAIKADKLTWAHVSDLKGWKNTVAVLYFVKGIPRNLLIDPQGRIVASNLREEALGEKLSELLK